MYDVVIAGASFAGLSIAREIEGNVLLIDRKRVGRGQTSACVTPRPSLEAVGAEESILQQFNQAVLHLPSMTLSFEFTPPFCAFDYETFCQSVLRQAPAETVTATVEGMAGNRVLTNKGDFGGKVIVDATGWRAVLASSVDPAFGKASRTRLSFGYETLLPHRDDKLHFYYEPKSLGRGYAWLFPCGEKTRFGIGSYRCETRLKDAFGAFLADFGLETDSLHGGFFPHRLRKGVAGRVFVAGDAAGLCFPGSGEGIRTAVFFGQKCGRIIQRVLDGALTLEAGLEEYQRLIASRAKYYDFLFNFQRMLMFIPLPVATRVASYIHGRFDSFFEKYLKITEDESKI